MLVFVSWPLHSLSPQLACVPMLLLPATLPLPVSPWAAHLGLLTSAQACQPPPPPPSTAPPPSPSALCVCVFIVHLSSGMYAFFSSFLTRKWAWEQQPQSVAFAVTSPWCWKGFSLRVSTPWACPVMNTGMNGGRKGHFCIWKCYWNPKGNEQGKDWGAEVFWRNLSVLWKNCPLQEAFSSPSFPFGIKASLSLPTPSLQLRWGGWFQRSSTFLLLVW